MIIRRKHTANFTTIGNALFNDERLAADEVGVLAYLLSRPQDWEVRRPALMRRWKIGREATKRIMTNLIRTGWCFAVVTRLGNGTVHIVYEIRDEPGPTLSVDQVRNALSLVSSEASETEEKDGTTPGDVPPHTPSETSQPPTGQPYAVDEGAASRSPPIRVLLKPDLEKPESTNLGGGFSIFREGWPSDHVLSLVACEKMFASLNETDQQAAVRGMPLYLADCRKVVRKVCDLATYFRERRWDRLVSVSQTPTYFHVTRGTPQAMRWRQWLVENEPHRLKHFDAAMAGQGYTMKSEWPPAKGQSVKEGAETQNARA